MLMCRLARSAIVRTLLVGQHVLLLGLGVLQLGGVKRLDARQQRFLRLFRGNICARFAWVRGPNPVRGDFKELKIINLDKKKINTSERQPNGGH